jgi:hypothetical protein
VPTPQWNRIPFLCHLTFTASGHEQGDIVQVITFHTPSIINIIPPTRSHEKFLFSFLPLLLEMNIFTVAVCFSTLWLNKNFLSLRGKREQAKIALVEYLHFTLSNFMMTIVGLSLAQHCLLSSLNFFFSFRIFSLIAREFQSIIETYGVKKYKQMLESLFQQALLQQ